MDEVGSDHRSQWRLDIPQERPLSRASFRKLATRLLELHKHLIDAHRAFAHLIRIEDGDDQVRIGFFRSDRDMPHTMFLFEFRTCRIICCDHDHRHTRRTDEREKEIEDLDTGIYRLINFVRLTAQDPMVNRSTVHELIAGLQARPSKSSPVASSSF